MAQVLIAALFEVLSVILAIRANARFRAEARIPMQWWFDGSVNWSAPRRVAFALFPVLALYVLGLQVVLAATVPPRPGDEAKVLPILCLSGVLVLGIQWLHAALVGWTLRRRDR